MKQLQQQKISSEFTFFIVIGLVFCYSFIKIFDLITSHIYFNSFISHLYDVFVKTVLIYLFILSYSRSLSIFLSLCC